MNRRVFVTAGAGMAVTGWFGHPFASRPVCAACMVRTVRTQPAIAIVDPSLSESVAWASAAARNGARIVECGAEVAVLWYEVLARSRAPLIGALRTSDFFVLRHLARSDGRAVAQEAVGARIANMVAFRIAGARR